MFANNKGVDQPVHPRSLISAFVIRLLGSKIIQLAASELSIFKLVSVAEQDGLTLAIRETPKTGFLAMRHILLYAYTMHNKFSNCLVWVSPSTSDLEADHLTRFSIKKYRITERSGRDTVTFDLKTSG